MLNGAYDPFRNVVGDKSAAQGISPSLHVGIVKSYNSTTKACMVLVPSVNDTEELGPIRILKPLTGATHTVPSINTVVIVGCIDGNFDDMVILGTFA